MLYLLSSTFQLWIIAGSFKIKDNKTITNEFSNFTKNNVCAEQRLLIQRYCSVIRLTHGQNTGSRWQSLKIIKKLRRLVEELNYNVKKRLVTTSAIIYLRLQNSCLMHILNQHIFISKSFDEFKRTVSLPANIL